MPEWVTPAPASAVSASAGPDTSALIVLDQQQRIVDGQVWAYQETVSRMASGEMLQQAGNLKLMWQPDEGDLIIHRVTIVRDGQEIDLLKGGAKFTVLRREGQLEALQMSGVLTATLAAEGLRVGDVLRVAHSTTSRDAVLKGDAQALMPLVSEPLQIGFARARLLWKPGTDLRYRTYARDVVLTPRDVGGYREIEVKLPLGKPPEMPGDAPPRYRPLPILEATTFGDWAAVSRTMAPLYATAGLVAAGSPLAAEIDRIAKAESDPRRRAAAALRVVQDGVRYLAIGMNGGNYRPQTPAETWSLRYGDCKAKTLMLLAMLHGLGIEAEAVLASSGLGDYVPMRLPAPLAFDHIIVRATIAGQPLWLDGTGLGARLADIDDTPPFGWVLPVRAQGAELMPLVRKPDARPAVAVAVTYDQSAGIGLPTLYSATLTMRGREAGMLGAMLPQISADQRKEMLQGLLGRAVPGAHPITQAIAQDTESGTLVVTGTGIVSSGWRMEDKRWMRGLDQVVENISFEPDRARPAWRDIPVLTDGSPSLAYRIRLTLPDGGKGYVLDGDRTLPATLGGVRVARTATLTDGIVVVDERADPTGQEIAPADIAAERQRMTLAKARLLRVRAPDNVPPRWQLVSSARAAGRLKPIEAAYAQAIAAAPKEKLGYTNRAAFRSAIYEWRGVIADLDRAIAIEPDIDLYITRAQIRAQVGETAKALADAQTALGLDPGSMGALALVVTLQGRLGKVDDALAAIDAKIAEGGKDRSGFLQIKADVLVDAGKPAEAVSAMDAANADRPGNPELLNGRCWTKATGNVSLETALKDCTRSIELGESPAAAFDSRALVYYRLGRYDEALADIDAALSINPGLAASLYLRGVILMRKGDPAAAGPDLAAARMMTPLIDERYGRWGIRP